MNGRAGNAGCESHYKYHGARFHPPRDDAKNWIHLVDLDARAFNHETGVSRDAMYSAVLAHRGRRRITLLTDGVNEAAQRFCARQGFMPSSMLAMRRLL